MSTSSKEECVAALSIKRPGATLTDYSDDSSHDVELEFVNGTTREVYWDASKRTKDQFWWDVLDEIRGL